MNRNKLKAKVDGFRTINNDGYSIEKEDVKDLIDEICDEVNTRTRSSYFICENCKHYIEQSVSCFIMPIDIQLLPKDFGCLKFERKRKEFWI